MREDLKPSCSDCEAIDRRGFISAVGGTVAALTLPAVARAADEKPSTTAKAADPAEEMVKELYKSLSDEQKKTLVYPWDHGGAAGPTRLKMVNAPHFGKRIADSYTKAQQDLNHKIIKAISSGEEGYRRISREGKWDTSGSFEGCGAVIFGEAVQGKQFSWVFTGHHLTVRCDGNSEPGAGFGGPMYYGHSPNGWSPNNVWFYQTKAVVSVYDALNADQRKKALIKGKSPGEGEGSVKLKPAPEVRPGVGYGELTADQKKLVEQVMRTVIDPFRKEDGDEVMDIVKSNGGFDKMSLAFYEDAAMNDNQKWHFWRIEGPGFVWNYRILPHVHTFVNISSKI
jgi:hypothetical protein